MNWWHPWHPWVPWNPWHPWVPWHPWIPWLPWHPWSFLHPHPQADLDNDQTDDNDTAATTTTTHPTIFVNKSSSSKDNKFFIQYNHERRFRRFKCNLHRIHNHLIPRNLGLDLRLIVGNRNRPYAANELIHKKPQRWLLTNKAKKIKCKYQRFLGKFKTIYSSSDHILNFNCRST